MSKKLTIEFYFDDDEGKYRHAPIEKLIEKLKLQLLKTGMFVEKIIYEVAEIETHMSSD